MTANTNTSATRRQLWAGRVITALPVIMLMMSAIMKLSAQPALARQLVDILGYESSSLRTLGLLELACVIVYVVPQTSIMGAVLLTGYLGGAIAAHVRVSDPFVMPLLLGVLVWVGAYLRDDRLRSLLPLRRRPRAA